MVTAIRQHLKVQENGIIEIRSSELLTGADAEVILLIETPEPQKAPGGLTEFIGAAKGLYADVAEIDGFINNERDEWER